jgi:hypothetical protein
MSDLVVTFENPEGAHTLVQDVVRSPDRMLACACSDVQAFMRDVIGFPHEGVPTAQEWPELTERVGEFLTAPGRVLLRSLDEPVATTQVVEQLLTALPEAPVTDVLVAGSDASQLSSAEQAQLHELAAGRGVRIYLGV